MIREEKEGQDVGNKFIGVKGGSRSRKIDHKGRMAKVNRSKVI